MNPEKLLPAQKSVLNPWNVRIPILLVITFVLFANRSILAQGQGASLSIGTSLIDITHAKGNETDPFIAINPLNPSNMVVVAATDGTVPGLIVARTTNLGGTWVTNFIATNSDSQGLNPAAGPYAQPSVVFDSYSNLFVAYLPDSFLGVAVAVSTNGGATFTSLTNLAALDVTDQPRITSPIAGSAAGSVWVAYKDYTTAGTPVQVEGLVSTNLGAIGTFGYPQIVPGSGAGGFADIAVGPFGQVLVAFQDNLEGVNPTANIFVCAESNAIMDGALTYNSFSESNLVASDAIGGVTYIQAAPTGIGINAAPGLAWDFDIADVNYGNVDLVYTAVGPNGNTVISFNSSSSYGTNMIGANVIWNGEVYMDDDAVNGDNGTFNDHFLPHMAVDPVSGIIVCSWYDCRNDQGANSAVITNVITTNFTLSKLSIITNVSFVNNISDDFETNMESDGKSITNIILIVTADNIVGTVVSNDTTGDIFVGTNFTWTLSGTNSGSVGVKVIITNRLTKFYSAGSGTGNQEAVMYESVSSDGGRTFAPNQQLSPASENILPPAQGIASSVAGANSLTGWGHYTGTAAYGANFFPVWADNSDATTNNPAGADGNFDIYMINSAPGQGGGNGVPSADLTVFVTNTPNPVISQEVLTYSLIVSNRGPSAAPPSTLTNILSPFLKLVPNSVTPTLDATFNIEETTNGQTEIVFNLPGLGTNVVVTNTFRVSAAISSIATNLAGISAPLLDLVATNNTNTLITVIEGEDLAMGMTTTETNALIGDTVVSTVTVTNLGPATNGPVFITNFFSPAWTNVTVLAQGTNQVTNSASGPIAIVDLGLLPIGQPVTATFTAVAASGNTFGSESAIVTSQDIDTNLANNTAQINSFINDEDLAAGVVSSSPNVDQGVPFTYIISVTNLGLSYSGPISVTSEITTNILPLSTTQSQGSSEILLNQGAFNQVTFNLDTLGAGEVATLTILAEPVGLPPVGLNTVTVSSPNFDLVLTNNTSTSVVQVNDENLAVGVTASPASGQIGSPVTFTAIVTNLGVSSSGVVMETNTISSKFSSIAVLQPASGYTVNGNMVVVDLGIIAAGQSVPVVITAVPTSSGTGSNTVKVSSQIIDTNTANNTAFVKVPITSPIISNLVVTPLAGSAFIVFDSSSPSTAQVKYGLTTGYGLYSPASGPLASHHAILLTGLQEGATYDYQLLTFVGAVTLTNSGSFTTTNVLILNTQDARYSGVWLDGQFATGIYGSYYQYATTMVAAVTSYASYAPAIPAAGQYDVSIWYPSYPSFTTNAQVALKGGTNQELLSINQSINGGAWLPLVTNMYFASGTNGSVIIANNTGESNRLVVANAMMWVYNSAQDDPTNGSVPAWWANFYFGTNANGNINGADIASNGYSIYDNYVLGTDPTSPASGLSFTVTPVSNDVLSISFVPYVGGRNYQLQGTSDLVNWTTLTNQFTPGTNGAGAFTVTGANPANTFYRLSASVIPSP